MLSTSKWALAMLAIICFVQAGLMIGADAGAGLGIDVTQRTALVDPASGEGLAFDGWDLLFTHAALAQLGMDGSTAPGHKGIKPWYGSREAHHGGGGQDHGLHTLPAGAINKVALGLSESTEERPGYVVIANLETDDGYVHQLSGMVHSAEAIFEAPRGFVLGALAGKASGDTITALQLLWVDPASLQAIPTHQCSVNLTATSAPQGIKSSSDGELPSQADAHLSHTSSEVESAATAATSGSGSSPISPEAAAVGAVESACLDSTQPNTQERPTHNPAQLEGQCKQGLQTSHLAVPTPHPLPSDIPSRPDSNPDRLTAVSRNRLSRAVRIAHDLAELRVEQARLPVQQPAGHISNDQQEQATAVSYRPPSTRISRRLAMMGTTCGGPSHKKNDVLMLAFVCIGVGVMLTMAYWQLEGAGLMAWRRPPATLPTYTLGPNLYIKHSRAPTFSSWVPGTAHSDAAVSVLVLQPEFVVTDRWNATAYDMV